MACIVVAVVVGVVVVTMMAEILPGFPAHPDDSPTTTTERER